MELDDAFTKAALYETCVKSKVLRNIDLDKVDTQTLRGLVNKYNALSLREFPIIVSKVLIKFGMTFVTEKMPRLRSYINPNNISVQVEADELAYLERTQSNFQPNIYMIVAKNVAVGMLGTSIQSLHELITATVDTTKTTESDESAASRAQKIRVSSVQQTVPDIVTPKRFTRFADSFKSQAVGSPGRSVKQITTDLSRTYGSREKQRLATREERHNRRGAVLALQRGTATTDDDDDDEDGLSVVNDGREATAGEEDVEDDASTGDARSAEAFSDGANGFEEFEQSSRVASSREVEEAAKMELVGDTVTLAGDEDQNRGVGSSDALARVERFIEQSRPVANTIVSQPDSRMPTDVTDREVLKPLRSINADEFMTLVESNYTNLASDGVAVGKLRQQQQQQKLQQHTEKRAVPSTLYGGDLSEEKLQYDAEEDDGLEHTQKTSARTKGSSPHRVRQSLTYDTDSDDEEFDDTNGEFRYTRSLSSPTLSRPQPQRSLHSDASSVSLTFEDDDDNDREAVV